MIKEGNTNIAWIFEKKLIEYPRAIKKMELIVDDIVIKKGLQTIWIIEHFPVYTAGISAQDNDLLKITNIPVHKTNRGGKFTYHGPGMKIIYVMLDLKDLFYPYPPDIARFVEFLENWMINVLAQFSVIAEIKKGRVGIWVNTKNGEKKIAAIGIKIKKWVSYHGIALNIDPDLTAFSNIIPCGLKDFGVTSFAELGIKNFDEIFFQKTLMTEFNKLKEVFFKK